MQLEIKEHYERCKANNKDEPIAITLSERYANLITNRLNEKQNGTYYFIKINIKK